MDRRELLGWTGALVAGLGACKRDSAGEPARGAVEPGVIRVASVKTAVEGNLLPELIKTFEAQGEYTVRATTGSRVYDLARDGGADLVISHYGHKDAEAFVLDGQGEWPRTIFSNQMALLGPPSDPANVRGLEDAGEAFARIAKSGSKFVVNALDGVRYLTEILWNAAGRPDRAGWFVEEHTARELAMQRASDLGAYTLWGLTPFLRVAESAQLALEPLVLADPLLQRLLVSIIVKPAPGRRINTVGALAFQSYLLAPSTQAAIRAVRYPGDSAAWTPAGRHNRTGILPPL